MPTASPSASRALRQLYELAVTPPGSACRRGCATCCTQSVTVTALEGELIRDYLPAAELAAFLAGVDGRQLKRPRLTTNQYVGQFLARQPAADAASGWSLAPCPFLVAAGCAIYPVRPFMCRGFVSRVDCRAGGYAEVAPQILLRNTIIQQVIEQLSQGREWGLLSDVLAQLLAPAGDGGVLLRCEAVPGFILDERERRQLRKYLDKIYRIMATTEERRPERDHLLQHLGAPE